ncbi:MAG: ribonuclease D [Planctomycetota bacterium]|nr:MAG: ribonuclease D [Planctomycetota bacterium]
MHPQRSGSPRRDPQPDAQPDRTLPPVPAPIATVREREALIARLADTPKIAFDTEFHPEGSYLPQLMLLQLATDEFAATLDPLAVDPAPLVEALCAPGRTLVLHAAQADLAILHSRFGRLPARVFDTQLAAAFAGHRLQESLATLVHQRLGLEVSKGQRFTDWSRRPLSERQIRYALGDVQPLLALARDLEDELRRRGRLAWFEEDAARLTAAATHERDPLELARRIRGAERLDPRAFAVLVELVATRERLAETRDVPRSRIASNAVLLELARRQPTDRKALTATGGLPNAVVRRHGEALLAAIARGRSRDAHSLPAPPPPRRVTDPRLDAMRAVVRTLAASLDLPAELLANAATLRAPFASPIPDRAAFARALGLTGWRAELLLEPLWRSYTETPAH